MRRYDELKLFPPPKPGQDDGFNQLRIADIKPIIEYHHHIRPSSRSKVNGSKSLLLTRMRDCLAHAYSHHDRKKYEDLLGYIMYKGKQNPRATLAYEEFTWINKRNYPIPVEGSWVEFDSNFHNKSVNNRPAYETTGVPSAVPGGLVNAQFMDSPAMSVANVTFAALDKLTFDDSGFVMPIKNITTPVICAPSNGRRHNKTISVKLTSDQVDLLSIDKSDPSKMQHGVYLYMAPYQKVCRELLDKPGKPVQVEMPASFMASVNSAGVAFNSSMPYKPIELTLPFRITTEYANRIDLIYTTGVPWVAAIVVAARHTPQSLACQIRGRELTSADEVRQQFFKSASENGDDDDVISEGALVNLKCPLGLCRIEIPSRSKNCKHLQCFDCETFLQFYQGKQQWRCPVCSIMIHSWQDLIIDGYFDEILKKTSENDEQIYIEPDGMWKTKNNTSTPKSSVKRTTGQPLEVSEVDAIDVSDLSSSEQNARPNKRRRTEFVDLTLDSDSDGSENDLDLPPLTQEEIEIINAAEATEAISGSNDNTEATSVATVATTSTTTPTPVESEPAHVAPAPRSMSSTLSDRTAAASSSATSFRPILPGAADPAMSASSASTPTFSRVSSEQPAANNTARIRHTMTPSSWAIAPRRWVDTTSRPASTSATTPIRVGHSSASTPPVSGHGNSRRSAYTDVHRRAHTGIGRRVTGNNIAPPKLARGASDINSQVQRSAVTSSTVHVPMSAPVSPTALISHSQASTAMVVAPMRAPNHPIPNRTPQQSPHRSPVVGMSPTYTTLFLNSQLGGTRPPVNNSSPNSQGDSRTTAM